MLGKAGLKPHCLGGHQNGPVPSSRRCLRWSPRGALKTTCWKLEMTGGGRLRLCLGERNGADGAEQMAQVGDMAAPVFAHRDRLNSCAGATCQPVVKGADCLPRAGIHTAWEKP